MYKITRNNSNGRYYITYGGGYVGNKNGYATLAAAKHARTNLESKGRP